jgi:zinc/manganese transport system substrate-binding protein
MSKPSPARRLLIALAAATLVVAGCGDDDDATTQATGSETTPETTAQPEERPTIVATTSILGDIVENVAGGEVEVVTIMPAGADPHTFQASAQQANQLRQADALVVNGGGFEEGLLDVIEAAEGDGVVVHEALSAVDVIDFADGQGHSHGDEDDDHGHDDDDHGHEDEDDHGHSHDDDDHGTEDDHGHEDEDDHGHEDEDDHGHAHDGEDPHFFTDPVRTAAAAEGIAEFLIEQVEGIDEEAVRTATEAYVAELEDLDAEIEALLADIPDERRVLVTNHEVFGYFADRYDFEVVGTVIPAGTTAEGGSAGALARLATVVREEGVPAIFTDETTADNLARTVADEVGDVEVVALFSESLGPDGSGAETYLGMMRTNAERIAEALGTGNP